MIFTKKFLTALIAVALSLVLIACVFFFVLSGWLDAYEHSIPVNTLNGFLASVTESQWQDAFYNAVNGRTGVYESPSSAAEYLYNVLVKDRNLLSVEMPGEDKVVYDLYLGRYPVAEIEMIPGEDLGFNFRRWEISSFSVNDDTVNTLYTDVTVTVKSGSEVVCNGITLTDSVSVPSPSLTLWDQRFNDSYLCDVYSLGKTWSSPYVTVSGEVLQPDKSGQFVSDYDFETVSVSYTVPGDASLYFNDILVGSDYITRHDAVQPSCAYEKEGLEYVTYSVDGLLEQPLVSVILCEDFLEPDASSTTYSYPARTETVRLPSDLTLNVNGKTVSEPPTECVPDVLSVYRDGMVEPDVFVCYTFEDVLGDLSFETNDETIRIGDTYYKTASDKFSDYCQKTATDFADLYIRYVFRMILADEPETMTVSGSKAYKLLENSRSGVYWNSKFNCTSFNADVSDCVSFAKNGCACVVSYHATGDMIKPKKEVPEDKRHTEISGKIRLWMITDGDGAGIFDMEFLE